MAVVVAVLSAVLGYAAHVLQSRVPTKDNQDSIDDALPRRLGADQLRVLVSDPHLRPEDLRRVRAAIKSALVSGVVPWEDDERGSGVQRP